MLTPAASIRLFIALSAIATMAVARADGENKADKPVSHSWRDIEGWRIHVDNRLLEGEHAEFGATALQLLEDRLRDVKRLVQPNRVESLQRVVIQIDLSHGKLTSMQYHPSAGWLRDNGYSEDLVKRVHIPKAAHFTDPHHQQVQPWSVLHELAHAYHDQVLDFGNKQIRAAWESYRDAGHGDDVLHVNGHRTEHYALTNHKEFFAEMSEAYVGHNDFYPFNRGELRHALPEVHALMRELWGPLRRK